MTTASLTASSLQPIGAASATPRSAADAEADQLRSGQKTMASKVLAAMALERVTGRKADPGRLAEAN